MRMIQIKWFASQFKDEGHPKTEEGNDSNNNGEAAPEAAEEKAKAAPSNGSKGFSLNAPPFVPSQQQQAVPPPPPPPALPPTSAVPTSRPNLFLYSPASNTMIPCEEIIIPNPVMGPEVGVKYLVLLECPFAQSKEVRNFHLARQT